MSQPQKSTHSGQLSLNNRPGPKSIKPKPPQEKEKMGNLKNIPDVVPSSQSDDKKEKSKPVVEKSSTQKQNDTEQKKSTATTSSSSVEVKKNGNAAATDDEKLINGSKTASKSSSNEPISDEKKKKTAKESNKQSEKKETEATAKVDKDKSAKKTEEKTTNKSDDKPSATKPEEAKKDDKKSAKSVEIDWGNDEMEPLLMQVDLNEPNFDQLPSTPQDGSKSRVLRLRSGPPVATSSPVVPEQQPPAESSSASPAKSSIGFVASLRNNFSTIVNLSTASDQSSKAGLSTPAKISKSSSGYGSEIRVVSGRRSIHGNSFQQSYRDRKFNDSVSSMNATVGSEIPNESFSFFRRKRAGDDIEQIVDDVAESPKRARLEGSGFLGMVTSPVMLLRRYFSRSHLQSTPNGKKEGQDEVDKEIIDVDTIIDADVEITEEKSKAEEGIIKESPITEQTPSVVEGEKIQTETVGGDGKENIKNVIDDKQMEIGESGDDLIVVTDVTRRRRCTIM